MKGESCRRKSKMEEEKERWRKDEKGGIRKMEGIRREE